MITFLSVCDIWWFKYALAPGGGVLIQLKLYYHIIKRGEIKGENVWGGRWEGWPMDVRIIAGVRNFLTWSGEGVWRRCKKDEEKIPHFWMRAGLWVVWRWAEFWRWDFCSANRRGGMWIDLMAGCGGFNNPKWDSFLLYNTFYITYLGLAGDGMRGDW